MPRLSVWLVRASLVYFAIGVTLGAVLLAGREVADGPWVIRLRPVHAELLLFGWTLQLIMGVAYWILPRFRTGNERGNAALAWTSYWLLNLGVPLAVVGSALGSGRSLALVGRVLEALGAAAFVAHALPRIKAFGTGR
ncbi:MAG TPA: cbb3-type cytochrome c oxidase subunit I [Gemmatimonadales bacterium]|nr:cbb3-type cytochrome c oxidase subunit I [Gemmatimonadales bacterium]